MKTLLKWFILVISVLLVSCVALMVMRNTYAKMALKPVSEQVGIEPNWASYNRYIEETYVEGISREQVYERLEEISGHKKTPIRHATAEGYMCEIVTLPTGKTILFPPPTLQYMFCYSPKDNILKSKALYPG